MRRPVNVSESNEENNIITINKLIANSINITNGPKLDEPLCFTAADAGATITFNKVGDLVDRANIVTSTDG